LQMRVLAHDPVVTAERAHKAGVELCDFDTLLAESDVLTVHVPLTDATRGVIGARELARMKQGARVVNVARGGIIDEHALAQAITDGHIAGAAIDVFDQERPRLLGLAYRMLGTIAAAVRLGGYDVQFWSLIVPHGVLELSVIIISGGTGLMLGDAILRPGQLRRGEALARVAARAVLLALGTASLLIIAGTLEAFVSPSSLPAAAKLAIGATVGMLLYGWLLLAGRGSQRRRSVGFDRPAESPA